MARPIAERLCRAVQDMPFDIPGFAPLALTASIGLAIGDVKTGWVEQPVASVIDQADQALLVAKSAGRNQVTISKSAA